MRKQEGRTSMSGLRWRLMWRNTLVEKEANREVHKRETSLMQGPSPKESSHVSISENLDTSRRKNDTLRKTKVLRMMSNLERFLRRRALQSWLQAKKSLCSFVSTRVQTLQMKSVPG